MKNKQVVEFKTPRLRKGYHLIDNINILTETDSMKAIIDVFGSFMSDEYQSLVDTISKTFDADTPSPSVTVLFLPEKTKYPLRVIENEEAKGVVRIKLLSGLKDSEGILIGKGYAVANLETSKMSNVTANDTSLVSLELMLKTMFSLGDRDSKEKDILSLNSFKEDNMNLFLYKHVQNYNIANSLGHLATNVNFEFYNIEHEDQQPKFVVSDITMFDDASFGIEMYERYAISISTVGKLTIYALNDYEMSLEDLLVDLNNMGVVSASIISDNGMDIKWSNRYKIEYMDLKGVARHIDLSTVNKTIVRNSTAILKKGKDTELESIPVNLYKGMFGKNSNLIYTILYLYANTKKEHRDIDDILLLTGLTDHNKELVKTMIDRSNMTLNVIDEKEYNL